MQAASGKDPLKFNGNDIFHIFILYPFLPFLYPYVPLSPSSFLPYSFPILFNSENNEKYRRWAVLRISAFKVGTSKSYLMVAKLVK
jgi:hypothetical protein